MANVISRAEQGLVDMAKNQLMEHFDQTGCYTMGGGNIFAQQGLARDWLMQMETAGIERAEEE